MSIKFGVFDVPLGGDPLKYNYSGEDLRTLVASIFTNGIIPEIKQSTTNNMLPSVQLGMSLSASAGQGLKLIINRGIVVINGAVAAVCESEEIAVQAGGINDIVFRLDLRESEVVFGLFVKKRQGFSIQQELTRAGGVYELGLHSVNIPIGCTQVTSDMITDYRLNMVAGSDGKPCCGIVGSLMMPDIDTWYRVATSEQQAWLTQSRMDYLTWFAQSQSDYHAWFTQITKAAETDIARLTQQFEQFLTDKNEEFDLWFGGAQSIYMQKLAEAVEQAKQEVLEGVIAYDPSTGLRVPLQEILNNIYDATKTAPITAKEFRDLQLTAKEFRDKRISAYEFSTRGKAILGG